VVVVLACLFSLFLAWNSVWSVWTPHPTIVKPGETEGVFPWAKLSYPLYLSVYHSNATWIDTVSVGQVQVKVMFVNVRIIEVDGTFSFYGGAFSSGLIHYSFDFTDALFDSLVILLMLFNIMGAMLGIILAKMLRKRVEKIGQP
jgi:hypothetical protein